MGVRVPPVAPNKSILNKCVSVWKIIIASYYKHAMCLCIMQYKQLKRKYNMTQLLTITQDNRDIFHGSHEAVVDLLKALGLSSLVNSTATKLVV